MRATIAADVSSEPLERAIAASCRAGQTWPSAVAAGVYAALEFAAAFPTAAQLLTAPARIRWHDADPDFTALVDRLAALLSREAPPPNPRLPDAKGVVRRIARQVNLQIEAGRAERMMEIAPDLTFLALMPYIGFAEARRWAELAPQAIVTA
jgi:hypothetical protein